MRDVYAGVLMPGFALLGGLWVRGALVAPGSFDRAMARGTLVLLAAVAVLLPGAALVTIWRASGPPPALSLFILLVTALAALLLAIRGWRVLRGDRLAPALAVGVAVWVVTLLGVAPVLFPVINRSQDLSPVAEAAAKAAAEHPVVLWQPDETIIGTLDLYASLTPPCVFAREELRQRLTGTPDLRVLTEVSASRGKERRLTDLGREFGLEVQRRIDLPAPLGRKYAILALPGR
jgi:hypothetical protein